MAIKLSGSVSRKIPIAGLSYSSQSFSAGMEIEINSADASEVQAQLAQLYDSLSRGIDAQIATATPTPAAPVPHNGNGHVYVQTPHVSQAPPLPVQQRPVYTNGSGRNRVAAVTNGNGNGNGNDRRVSCTEAQAKCIYAICKAKGLDLVSVLADFNVSDPRDLHVRDASRLIDTLKNGNGAAAH